MTDTTTTSTRLRALADLIDAHPDLPLPYISAYSTGAIDAAWYLHNRTSDPAEQKATAARIVSALGGTWDKAERVQDTFQFTRSYHGVSLEVVVNREAVCRRVVKGTHEVTVPAEPARPAQVALPERTETVEDVTWVCSSLLAGTDVTLAAVTV